LSSSRARSLRCLLQQAQADAIHTLRYLDAEAAVTYLASIFGRNRCSESDIEYALYGSGQRVLAVRELERRMADPDLVVAQIFLVTLFQLYGGSRRRCQW
jgi:hypothetical protein